MNPSASNADPGELDKFARLAERWWDENGACAPLHAINPLRVGWIQRQAGALAGKRIADVGCGGGILAEALARHGAEVTGIDLAAEALDAARTHASESGVSVDYRLMSAEELADEAPGSFDVVTCLEMLEHVPNPAAIVEACGRLTRPDGIAAFSTINRRPRAWLEAIVAGEYLLGLLPRGTHAYAQFIRPPELARWGRDAGLDLVDETGLTYNPLTRHYRLTPDVGVNYLMAFRRPVGDDDA